MTGGEGRSSIAAFYFSRPTIFEDPLYIYMFRYFLWYFFHNDDKTKQLLYTAVNKVL